jgi:hypothetical protein
LLPNFLIIGAAKAGTTSLYRYVQSHPQAFMPERKELSFFCEEFNWKRGLRWYESYFGEAAGAVAVGEASPRYSVYPLYRDVPARIASLIPDVRLVYLVREPIQRMQSQYLDNVIQGLEKNPVEEALSDNPFYLTSSSYALQLEQYLEYFRRDQLLVVVSEELRLDRERVLSRVFAFLRVDPSWRAPVFDDEFLKMSQRRAPRQAFRKIWYSPFSRRVARILPRSFRSRFRTLTSTAVDTMSARISPAFRHHLESQLRDDIKQLYGFLDEGFDGWGIA